MSVIKPYVDFNYSGGSKKTKSLISRYYNKISPLVDAGYKPKKAANSKNRKLIAETFDTPFNRRQKAVPVPPEVSKIKIKGKRIRYSRAGVETRTEKQDSKAFATDTANYLRDVTTRLGGNRFRIRVGRNRIPGTYNADELIELVLQQQRKYGNASGLKDENATMTIEAVEFE